MKKTSLYFATFMLAVFTSLPVLAADVSAQIKADIESGKFAEAKALITSNPTVANSAVEELVAAAKKDLSKNPEASAKALEVAASFAGSINADTANVVAAALESIVDTISSSPATNAKTAQSDAMIATAITTIASSPTVVAAQPQLYAQASSIQSQIAQSTPSTGQGSSNSLQLAQQPQQQPGQQPLQNILPPSNPPTFQQRASGE